MSKPTITLRQKIAVLNAAIQSCTTMHGSVLGGDEHVVEAKKCDCEYGVTLRGLAIMRREIYEEIQKRKGMKDITFAVAEAKLKIVAYKDTLHVQL